MIQYTAKDVIKRAMGLADIENSSIISYYDHNAYLSLAWKKVNQSLINKGAKYYYKKVDIPGEGEYTLPYDFYQADVVRDKAGIVLQRKVNSQPDNSCYWDIVGNKLIVKGSYNNLELCYWYNPTTLTFPADIKDIDLPSDITSATGETCCGSKIVYWNADGDIYYYDISTNETAEIATVANISTVVAGKGAIFIKTTDHTYLISYSGTIILTRGTEFYPMLDSNNNIWLVYITDKTVRIVDYSNNVKEAVKITTTPSLTGVFLYDGNYFWGITASGLTDLISGTVLDSSTTSLNTAYLTMFDDYSAVVYNGNISYLDEEGEAVKIRSDLINPIIVGMFKADNTTGYGYLTSDGTKYYVESYVPDTSLDFPNTVFFDYLAYTLAYYYTVRQNADTTAIEKALSDAELTFFETMDNGSTYGRIINVYGGR